MTMEEETTPVKKAQEQVILETNPSGIDKLAPEATLDEPSADDSVEAKNTESGTRLHKLLLIMAKNDEEPTSEDGLGELKRLLDGGAQVNAKDADSETALHLAAANGLVEAAKMLIEFKAEVSEPDNEGRQPLHRACSEGRAELVQLLLDNGADINAKQNKKASPLHEACWAGHIEVVNILLEGGADTQITEEDDWTPLHAASRYGHTEVIRALLAKGKTNINAQEALEDWTALHVAIYNGYADAVSVLLEEGANFGIQDKDDWTPLMTATTQKQEDIVRKLLDQNGHLELEARKRSLELETRDKSGRTPLLTASINGFLAGAILLIEAGADCNFQSDRTKATPLIAASGWRYRRMVEALLKDSGRTDINTQDEDGWAALHFASNKGHSKVVELLLQHHANLHLITDDGQTALHLASKVGNENVAKLLLEIGADVDARDQDGKTALHLASDAGPEDYSEQESDELGPDDLSPEEKENEEFGSGRHDAVVKLLLESGARPDAKTNKNETALHLAASRGDPTRLDLILSSMEQRDMSTRNDQGRTAFYLACTAENWESAVESLLKSDKLRTAEFGRSDGEDDEIKWAANYPETHEVAKWLMEERWKRKKTVKPEGSDNWGVIEWAAYSRLPEVLSLLLTKSPRSSKIQALLKSMLESVLEPKPESNKQPANELREGTEQNRSYEVLSLLIASSPQTPSLKAELKPALKKTLDLALGKEVKQWEGHRRLLQVLSQLVATFSGTSEVDAALKSTLELVKKPGEGTTYEQLSQVLWLLISNSPRTPDIDAALQSAQKSISELVGSTEKRPQDPESASTQPKASKAEAGAPAQKGKTKDPGTTKLGRGVSQMTVPTAPTTRTGKDKIDYLHAIIDILRDPPFSQTHKDSKIDGPPKHNDKLSETLEDHEATIVQFYKGEGESGTLRRYRSLKEVIYDHGPGNIMEKTISDLKKILGGRSELAGSIVYLNTEPKFTWVHLPATNMVWMNDILLRIMNDEKCEGGPYHELKSFFRDSWVQVPDRTSSSRSMRPRTVTRRQENEVSGKQGNLKKEEEERSDKIRREEKKGEEGDQKSKKEGKNEKGKEEEEKEEEGKKEERKDGGKESPKADDRTEPEEDRRKKNKPDFGAASATYMPYFCFSTQHRDEAGLRGGQKRFTDMKTAYEDLNDAKSPVIHESPTLDEWYYHFASDEKSMRDRNSRNRTQVVTKAIAAGKGTKISEKNEPSQWTLLRVNQLWVWTIANKWLITATSCLFDDSNGTLVEGILEQLGKEVEAGGSASQPETASDMSRFVVDYCIGTYERLSKLEKPNPKQSEPEEATPGEPKPQDQGSIRQLFSDTINQIGRDEANLFNEFRNQTKRWRLSEPDKTAKDFTSPGDEDSPKWSLKAFLKASLQGSPKDLLKVSPDKASEGPSQGSTYEEIRLAIKKAEALYCDIKDIRDELNILKSAAQHQKTVEEGLTGGSRDVDLAAAYIVKDLKEMDSSAERIQSAINTTLSLLQSESANLQATLSLKQSKLSNYLANLATRQGEEARRQGKTLMVFTLVTILFLPLSFLSSMFALDVASFEQAPGWAFAVIFAVSLTFFVIVAWAAWRWARISPAEKSTTAGSESTKEESVDKAEDKGTVESSTEPVTSSTDIHQLPFFSCLTGRLRRRQSDEEVARRGGITHRK